MSGVATVAAHWRSGERRDGIVALGALLGLAVATKLTSFLLPVPRVLWSVRQLDRAGLLALTAAAPLAVGIARPVVPYWWHDAVGSIAAFVCASTSRESDTPNAWLSWGRTYHSQAHWAQSFTMLAVGTPLTLGFQGGSASYVWRCAAGASRIRRCG